MRLSLLILLVGLGCFCLGLYVGHSPQAETRSAHSESFRSDEVLSEEAPPSQLRFCAALIDPGLLRAELTRALTAAGTAPCRGSEATPAVTIEEPAPTPEQLAAFDRAQSFVSRAIAQGTMTSEQVQEARSLLATVDPSSQQDLRLRLIQAMNQDRLKLDSPGMMF